MSKTVVLNVTANTKEAQKEIKQVTKEVQETNKATTELTSAFDQATGGFISKGKGAIATVQNLGKGFLGAGANATKMGNLIKIALPQRVSVRYWWLLGRYLLSLLRHKKEQIN
jgi:hypothetical protein